MYGNWVSEKKLHVTSIVSDLYRTKGMVILLKHLGFVTMYHKTLHALYTKEIKKQTGSAFQGYCDHIQY